MLPNAIDETHIDALAAEIDAAFSGGSVPFWADVNGKVFSLAPEHRDKRLKLLDLYSRSLAARNISLAPRIVEFLGLIFDEAPLAFQSLTFERGTQQRLHQDTAYVVVSRPMHLAASWVALEDIRPGTGELEYFVGSHRLPDTLFGKRFKHWNLARDGHNAHNEFLDSLETTADSLKLERRRFLANKGDALIWAADLAHGGSKIEDRSKTRKSHATHYCPASARPNYLLSTHSPIALNAFNASLYCSKHYP